MTKPAPFRAWRVNLVWVCDYYDGPLRGLCRMNGTLMRFERDDAKDKYRVYQLSLMEKAKWLAAKAIFEVCVGRHCSYPYRANGGQFHRRRPAWLHSLLMSLYYRHRICWPPSTRRKTP